MKGFFEIDKAAIPYKSQKGMNTCASCGLYKLVGSPRMKPYGNFKKGIMVIGEFPEEMDDRKGRPFHSKVGRSLQRWYRDLGIDLFRDCLCLNAVNCYPRDAEKGFHFPTEHEISCCRQKIISAIKRNKPQVIILHGEYAVSSLIGYRWRKGFGSIDKWRGWAIPDHDFNAWVCPTYSMNFIERQEEQNETQVILENDLKQAFSLIGKPLPSIEKNIVFVDNMKEIMEVMDKPGSLMAFDIETTGLKPYNTDVHKIVTISFCNNLDRAYAMPFPAKRGQIRLLKQLLENPEIGKIAANMKYEDTWLKVLHDIEVSPWAFDTMQAAHILDNRVGITGLKFQSYVQLGVLGYEDEVSPFLESSDVNGVNQIEVLAQTWQGMRSLLFYNGMDSLLEYRLALQQMGELNYAWEP